MFDLKGITLLNTRPLGQNEELNNAIQQAQGIAISLPALAITGTSHKWLSTLPALQDIAQAIFISSNAVHFFFSVLLQNGIYWPEKIQVAAIGQATKKALEGYHIVVHHCPVQSDTEHLLAMTAFHSIEKQQILLIKGVGGRGLLSEILASRGALITEIDVYQRSLPRQTHLKNITEWHKLGVNIILFTSHQSMINVFKLIPVTNHDWLKKTTWLVLSNRLAAEAKKMGAKKVLITEPNKILEALYQFKQGLLDG